MRRMLSAVAALMLGTAVGSTLDAQACLGLNSPTNIQLSAEAGNSAKQFGLDLHFGKSTGVFFGVGGHYTDFDDTDANAKGATGTLGFQLGGGGEKKAAFCPIAQVGFSSGPDFGTVEISNIAAAGGLSVGIPVAAGDDFTIIPTASIMVVYNRAKVETGTLSDTSTDGYGILSGGAGFMISPRFVLKPFVNIPIGLDNADPTFGIVVSFGLGKGS